MSWPIAALGKVAVLARDVILPEKILDGQLYVGLENISKGGKFDSVGPVSAGELASAKFRFTTAHVLYGKLRPYLAKIALPDFSGICSTDIIPILPGPQLDRRYLAHFLLTPRMVALASDRASGANLPRLSPNALLEFQIPLPPLEEQRRIAAILDKAEELRAKCRATLALLDQLPQAIFLEMFGDPIANPRAWQYVSCDLLCNRITVGIVVKPASYYKPIGVPALRSQNIRPNQVVADNLVYVSCEDNERRLAKTRVWQGDVVLVRTGQPGTAAVIPEELNGVNAIDLLITSPTSGVVNSEYLCHYFNSDGGKQQALGAQRGQIQQHLNVASLKSAKIPLPPYELQVEFERKIRFVKEQRFVAERAFAKFSALMVFLQISLVES